MNKNTKNTQHETNKKHTPPENNKNEHIQKHTESTREANKQKTKTINAINKKTIYATTSRKK